MSSPDAVVRFLFRIHSSFADPPEQQDDPSSLAWFLEFPLGWEPSHGPFPLLLTRSTDVIADCTPDYLKAAKVSTQVQKYQSYFDRCDDAFAVNGFSRGCVVEPLEVTNSKHGTMFITGSDLLIVARRALMLNFDTEERDLNAAVPMHITIAYGADKLTFNATMLLGDDDPARFNDCDVRAIKRLAGIPRNEPLLSVPDDSTEDPTASPEEIPDSYDDVSAVHGDVGVRPQSQIAESTPVPPLENISFDVNDSVSFLTDASLHACVSPSDKYNALGTLIQTMYRPGATAVIVGDHPGTLGRNLVTSGFHVVGYDVINEQRYEPADEYQASYARHRAELNQDGGAIVDSNGNALLVPHAAVYVYDTSADGERPEAATQRNLRAAARMKMMNPNATVISQLRSPPLLEIRLGILDLPGHSDQGAECYAVILGDGNRNFGIANVDWQHACWAMIRAEAEEDHDVDMDAKSMFTGMETVAGDMQFRFIVADRWLYMHEIFDKFWRPHKHPLELLYPDDTPDDLMPPMRSSVNPTYCSSSIYWYSFISSRTFMRASRSRRGGALIGAVTDSDDPVHLLAKLETRYGRTITSEPSINKRFEPEHVESLSGVSAGVLARHPAFYPIIKARYEDLVRHTEFSERRTPYRMRSVFKAPGSGFLLRNLSAIRLLSDDHNWRGPQVARYKRVLPYELMAALASRSLYTLVKHYVIACKHGLGKPLHSWELQYLLWTLTVHGSDNERVMYMGTRLRGALFPYSNSRRNIALGPPDTRPITNFEDALVRLGVFGNYCDADQDWEGHVTKIFANSSGGPRPMIGYNRDAARATHRRNTSNLTSAALQGLDATMAVTPSPPLPPPFGHVTQNERLAALNAT